MYNSTPADSTPIRPDPIPPIPPCAPPRPRVKLDIAYRFSNIFGLNKRQSELDFVDVLVDADIPLYVDPFAFKIGDDDFSIECNDLVISFFQDLVDALRNGEEHKARRLLDNLHEPNETRLGVSRPKPRELPQGRGVGTKQAQSLYAAFAKSKAVQTGILTDLSDCELFIEGISHDKISDVTVNIVRRKLIEFTKDQCRLHGVPMERKPTGVWWHEVAREWRGGYDMLPVYKGYPIILVPKATVCYRLAVDYAEYYGKHVIEYIRQEYEKQECLNSADSLTRVLRGKRRRVPKKSIREDYPPSKQFLREFSEKHPDVLAAYKREAVQAVVHGNFRPTDSGIYDTERKTAHILNLFMIEEVHQMAIENTVHGDNFGVVGQGNRVNIRDINVYKQMVGGLGVDAELQQKLVQAREVLDQLELPPTRKGDAQDDLGKLAEEMAKPEKDEGRIHRLWRNIKEVAPTVASVLASAATLGKIVAGS
jgi:hypothetical protein